MGGLHLRVIVAIVALSIVAGWFVLLRPTALGGSTSYILVNGHSMEPTYHTGDLVIVQKHHSYGIGDKVAYRAMGEFIIHRIVGGDGTAGFTMRGDNNNFDDPFTPATQNIGGEAWFHIEGGGALLQRAKQPVVLVIFGALVGAGALFGTGQKRSKRKGRWKKMSQKDGVNDQGAPVWAITTLIVLGAAAVLCLALAVVSWRDPSTRSTAADALSYSQNAAFGYSAQGSPSALYPDGHVGPVVASGNADQDAKAIQPIYVSSNPQVDVQSNTAWLFLRPSTPTDSPVRFRARWLSVRATTDGRRLSPSRRPSLSRERLRQHPSHWTFRESNP